ncbi:GntR family transcriptional regulator [Micromonospora sp. NPDC057141]|uniref:GntR family transcriptional regulator n=1 Tax=Micromonospora sp. NPDC057141 TaxID=3346033 RepID=UPI0036331753
MKARRTVRHRRVGYRRANLRAATATGPTGRRASSATRADPTTPDTSRHPGRTDGNVPTTGRVVYTSKRVSWLTLGKTSARYGEQVPTPHYGQPRYRAIADELSSRIDRGILQSGTLLPTESALAVEFRASRGTIRQAIAVLRDSGLVLTEHGRGTFVAPNPCTPRQNARTTTTTYQEVPADQELARILDVEAGASIIRKETVEYCGSRVDRVTRSYRRKQQLP